MVNAGDKIRVDGKDATVELRWASGKHVQFKLSDGRTMIDLHKRTDVEHLSKPVSGLRDVRPTERVVRAKPLRIEGTVEEVRDNMPNGEDLLD